MKPIIQPGAFSHARPALVVNTKTAEQIKVKSIKPWVYCRTCFDTRDANGTRRVFDADGTLYLGGDFILVNYYLE